MKYRGAQQPLSSFEPSCTSALFLTFPDEEFCERSLSINLDGEESHLTLIDHKFEEMSVRRNKKVNCTS